MSLEQANTVPTMPKERSNASAKKLDPKQLALCASMLRQGDPLADALVLELQTLGAEGKTLLDRGLASGLASLTLPPPALEAFLRQAETVPPGVEPSGISAAMETYLSVPPFFFGATMTSSILHTYASPAIARQLVHTGELVTAVQRRLKTTGIWFQKVMLPENLSRGAPGYIASLEVRLLHARIRAASLKHGWEVDQLGVPINQMDLASTWLDFAYLPVVAQEKLGFSFSEKQLHTHYELWRYIAHLMGVNPLLYGDVNCHQSAQALLELIETTNLAPDSNSCKLATAMFDSITAKITNRTLKSVFGALVRALMQHIHGKKFLQSLSVRPTKAVHLVKLLVRSNKRSQQKLRSTPGAWEKQISKTVAEYRAATEPEKAES